MEKAHKIKLNVNCLFSTFLLHISRKPFFSKDKAILRIICSYNSLDKIHYREKYLSPTAPPQKKQNIKELL